MKKEKLLIPKLTKRQKVVLKNNIKAEDKKEIIVQTIKSRYGTIKFKKSLKTGQYRWSMQSRNGQIIVIPGETYTTLQSVNKNLLAVIKLINNII